MIIECDDLGHKAIMVSVNNAQLRLRLMLEKAFIELLVILGSPQTFNHLIFIFNALDFHR